MGVLLRAGFQSKGTVASAPQKMSGKTEVEWEKRCLDGDAYKAHEGPSKAKRWGRKDASGAAGEVREVWWGLGSAQKNPGEPSRCSWIQLTCWGSGCLCQARVEVTFYRGKTWNGIIYRIFVLTSFISFLLHIFLYYHQPNVATHYVFIYFVFILLCLICGYI